MTNKAAEVRLEGIGKRYGKIEAMVLGLDGVLADGSAYSVDGASPDAPK